MSTTLRAQPSRVDEAPAVLCLSVVMPCLNEADTIGTCVSKARAAMETNGISGEIIVADNGSTDGSQAIARDLGARVVHVRERGYGNALMGGIEEARGEFILMGDADDSYDFLELPKFVAKLQEGHDLVQGCRLPSGGGRILPGAMPFLHRWWGNPMLSAIARLWFRVPIHDIYCGMRGFRKELYDDLGQVCTGMEFATENIIKASIFGAKIAEVPITLHPDGRKAHAPHLRTFRDGWRTLRFFLLYSPRWLFLIPGMLLALLGAIGYAIALPGLRIGGLHFDAHTLLVSSLAIICGYQAVWFAILTKVFAYGARLLPYDPRMGPILRQSRFTLETGAMAGVLACVVGVVLIALALNDWRLVGFGGLDYAHTMRRVIPAVTLVTLGFQTILSSFFVGILGLRRR